jgi:aspartate/methionine/tyrosine aminotransferase
MIGTHLAERLGHLGPLADHSASPVFVPPAILATVRDAMLAGETHYTSRPGLPELRALVASELIRLAAPSYDSATEVIITAGEREAVFVTLLGLRPDAGEVWTVGDAAPYAALFRFSGLTPSPIDDDRGSSPRAARLLYRDRHATFTVHQRAVERAAEACVPDVVNIGAAVGCPDTTSVPHGIGDRTILLGGLDGLAGQQAFGAGFVAGPAALLDSIRTWKQAFSICTAAPSQRAALAALQAFRAARTEVQ